MTPIWSDDHGHVDLALIRHLEGGADMGIALLRVVGLEPRTDGRVTLVVAGFGVVVPAAVGPQCCARVLDQRLVDDNPGVSRAIAGAGHLAGSCFHHEIVGLENRLCERRTEPIFGAE